MYVCVRSAKPLRAGCLLARIRCCNCKRVLTHISLSSYLTPDMASASYSTTCVPEATISQKRRRQEGTIPTTFSTALPQCEVENKRLADLLIDLHYAAIEYSSDVLSVHQVRVCPLTGPCMPSGCGLPHDRFLLLLLHHRATKCLRAGSVPGPETMPAAAHTLLVTMRTMPFSVHHDTPIPSTRPCPYFPLGVGHSNVPRQFVFDSGGGN